MLRNFLKLEPALQLYHSEQNLAFPLTEAELSAAAEILRALTHVEIAISRLSNEDATMRSADLAIQVRFEVFPTDARRISLI